MNGRKRVRKLVCYTSYMLRSIYRGEEIAKPVPCLCGPGFKHCHPPLTLDDLRHLYVRHGIRFRCMLWGGRQIRASFARIVCSKYFGVSADLHLGKVTRVMERSESSLREGYLRGVLMARGDGVYGEGRVTSTSDSRLQVCGGLCRGSMCPLDIDTSFGRNIYIYVYIKQCKIL